MFSATKLAIESKIIQTQENIDQVGLELGKLEKDGDLFDEPLMHQLHNRREQLDRELNTLNRHLREVSTRGTEKNLGSTDVVGLGQDVRVRIRYEDNSVEDLHLTTGTQLDYIFISDRPPFDGDIRVLVSDYSPIGKALLGAREGDEVSYRVGEKYNFVKIQKISRSEFLD